MQRFDTLRRNELDNETIVTNFTILTVNRHMC